MKILCCVCFRVWFGVADGSVAAKLLSSLSIQHFSVFVNSIVSPADVVCALSSSTLVDMYRKCGHFVTLVAGGSPGHFGMPVPRL